MFAAWCQRRSSLDPVHIISGEQCISLISVDIHNVVEALND